MQFKCSYFHYTYISYIIVNIGIRTPNFSDLKKKIYILPAKLTAMLTKYFMLLSIYQSIHTILKTLIFQILFFSPIRSYYLLNDIDDQNDDDDVDSVPISGHSSEENAKWAQSRL